MRFFRYLLFLVALLLLSIGYLTFAISKVDAVDAIPGGDKIPCPDINGADPNFNSDRPYQASPCGDSPKALFCSNSVVLTLGTVTASGDDASCNGNICACDTPSCSKTIDKLIVDLTNVQLPVLGNTQQIMNSSSSASTIDDATRMNNYVSPYLNGTNNQAENGQTDPTKVVDFAGPINKLLPNTIQDSQRKATLQTIYDSTVSTDEQTGQQTLDYSNHDQIVACADNNLGVIGDLLGIGIMTPKNCYQGNNTKAQGDQVLRLSTWDGDLSWWNTGSNLIINTLTILLPDIPKQFIVDSIGNHWNKRWPPLPWSNENNQPFASNILYQKAYNEWHGETCVLVPVFNKLICLDNVFVPNEYADLYKYVPLSNTVDKSATQLINSVEFQSGGRAVIDKSDYQLVKSPPLFFPHTQEGVDLSSLLQKTFKPSGQSGTSIPNDVGVNSTCQTLNSYTNPGDDISFTTPKSYLEVDSLYYHVSTISCTTKVIQICDAWADPTDLKGCLHYTNKTVRDCTDDIYVTIPMQNKSPNLDQIWNNTVAGNQSIFRRIFPQPGINAPVSCIADAPGVSPITYTSDSKPQLMRVIEPDGSSVGSGGKTSSSIDAQMYFPHLGGIEQYFLQGIQTALRPKGFGEQLPKTQCVSTGPDKGACKQWLFEKDSKGQLYYDKIIAAAGAASCKGKHLNPVWAIAIALNENGGLMSDSSTGKSTSHFGCNISQLQTIEEKTSCMINTLTNDCLAGKTDEQILEEYGYPPGYTMYPITVLTPGASYPPPLFGSSDTKQIIFNLLHTDWVSVYKSVVPTFCPNSPHLDHVGPYN